MKIKIIAVNVLILMGVVAYFLEAPQSYLTRISVATGKIKSGADYYVEFQPQSELEDFLKDTVDKSLPGFKFKATESVEGDRIFFEIYSSEKGLAEARAKEVFFMLFKHQLDLVSAKYPDSNLLDGYESIDDFYYLNSLSQLSLQGGGLYMPLRFNFVFIDRPIKDLWSYLLFALVSMVCVSVCLWQVQMTLKESK